MREVVDAGLRRYTRHTVIAPGHLARALAEVRRTGTASASEEMTLGSASVASPILDGDGTCIAALAVVSRTGRGKLLRLAPAVRTAALSISRTLQAQAAPRSG